MKVQLTPYGKENKILALKDLRSITYLLLKDAKDLIDQDRFDLDNEFATQLDCKIFDVDLKPIGAKFECGDDKCVGIDFINEGDVYLNENISLDKLKDVYTTVDVLIDSVYKHDEINKGYLHIFLQILNKTIENIINGETTGANFWFEQLENYAFFMNEFGLEIIDDFYHYLKK